MFTRLTLATIILLVVTAGCATTNQASSNPNQASNNEQSNSSGIITSTTDADSYQMLPVMEGKIANLKLDASADGSTQQLKKGEVMAISLESNPSTGYSWFANISDTAVLVQMGESEYQTPLETSTPLVGAPGTQIFYFQAASSGSASLTLEYKRGWETNVAPEKTITMTINVE